MTYYISEQRLTDIVQAATDASVKKILSELGLKKTEISQREAYSRFGRANINRWLKSGKLVPARRGKTLWYDTTLLEILKSSSFLCNEPPVEYKSSSLRQSDSNNVTNH